MPRVPAIDDLTAAGETSFGHELAAALRGLAMRASMEDFKHPWHHAREHGYDRVSGEGYYRNDELLVAEVLRADGTRQGLAIGIGWRAGPRPRPT